VFEKAKTNPSVIKFREGQKEGVAANLAIEKKLYGEWVAELEAEKKEAEK
jgi:urea carboxylase